MIFTDEYLYIDLENAKVLVEGQECAITPTEFRLLRQFLLNQGQLLTYDLLLERLWDSGGQFVDKHALAVNVNRLVTLTGDNGILGKASNAKRSGVVCKSGGGGFGCNLVREKMEVKGRT